MALNNNPSAYARQRRALVTEALTFLHGWGYEELEVPLLVPVEELRGTLDPLAEDEHFRFVGPRGRLYLLRGDLTPVVARQIALRRPALGQVHRVSYANRIARLQRGLWADQAEAFELGIELIGPVGARADLEVICLALELAGRLRVPEVELHVGDVRLAQHWLHHVPSEQRGCVRAAIARRDVDALLEVGRALGWSTERRRAFSYLAHPLPEAPQLSALAEPLERTGQEIAAELRSLLSTLEELGFGERVRLDLSVLDDRGYYTGVRFRLLSSPMGEILGAGGRYDELLQRFGADVPAVGFSMRVDRLVSLLASTDPGGGDDCSGVAALTELADALTRSRAGEAVRLAYPAGALDPEGR